jgi:hypothetical protein
LELATVARKKEEDRDESIISSTLHPREQNRNESGRLRQQISQVLVTPLPGLACGLPLRNTILALLITYVCTCAMSISFPTSDTRITLWYDDRRICTRARRRSETLQRGAG